MKRVTLLLILFCFFVKGNLLSQAIQRSNYDRRIVIVPAGQSRTFMFTNQNGLFYYGETGQPNTSRYQGLSYLTHKFLEDYLIEVSGTLLTRNQAEVHLMGDRLIRHFKNFSIEEEISMADSLPILMVKLRTKRKIPLAIAPLISGSKNKQDFVINWSTSDKVLYIAKKQNLANKKKQNYPAWIGICTYPEGEFATTGVEYLSKGSRRNKKNLFYPGKINIYLEDKAVVLFVIGKTKKEVLANRNVMLNKLNIEIKKQKSQIEGVRQAQAVPDDIFQGLF